MEVGESGSVEVAVGGDLGGDASGEGWWRWWSQEEGQWITWAGTATGRDRKEDGSMTGVGLLGACDDC